MTPPLNQAETCATGAQCGDVGRCIAPGQPPASTTAVLAADPPGVTTTPGGVAQAVQVRLAVYQPSAVTAATSTKVRVIGQDGSEVSCDATTFAAACTLESWTFTFDGTRHNASRPISVRSKPGTAAGHGEVLLRIDALDKDLTVPAGATRTLGTDGTYHGTAVESGAQDGFAITAVARGALILVRDPSRTIAPDGALILDLTNPATDRRTAWLRPQGAPSTAGAVAATYRSSNVTFNATTGALNVPLQFTINGLAYPWALTLIQHAPAKLECVTSGDCTAGETCLTALQACVPSIVSSPPASITGYLFEDPRSAQWWDAMVDVIGDQSSRTGNPAFTTSGADLIEHLMCTSTAAPGHLGIQQAKDSSNISHSGDLACVKNGVGVQTDNGPLNGAPGAIGLSTYRDRMHSAISSVLVQTCAADLARSPTSDFSSNFGPSTGGCVNPARALPALRMLATDNLNKNTAYYRDPRVRTLFSRLVQQWSDLHGFLASAGRASVDIEAATALSTSEARQKLQSLLDVEDAGWAALLDRRIVGPVSVVSQRAAGDESASFNPEVMDYRAVKQPALYWPFNHGEHAADDLIHHVRLSPPPSGRTDCGLDARFDFVLGRAWDCPELVGTLSTEDAHILQARDSSFVFHLGGHGDMDAPSSGVILATPTFIAYLNAPNDDQHYVLSVTHPFTNGLDRERVDFPDFGLWGGYTHFANEPTTVAIVRDGFDLTYTLYVWTSCTARVTIPGCTAGISSVVHSVTKSYAEDVSGTFGPGEISINRSLCPSSDPFDESTQCQSAGFDSQLDDLGVFNYPLSKREFVQFAQSSSVSSGHRELWPADLDVSTYGTQTLFMPVGATILEAQVAHLDLLASFVDVLRPLAQSACESRNPRARADLDAQLGRIGRTLRQNALLVRSTRNDLSNSAQKARTLLANKRAQLSRDAEQLATCKSPYNINNDEVPLYFGSIAPNIDEKKAFFAASDYLLDLADGRITQAQNNLQAVRTSWEQARQSQIQQLADDTSRSIRVNELQAKYGEGMRRLCGISDLTSEQVATQLETGTLSPQTCFVNPTTSCLVQNMSVSVANMDPACYRGAIGGSLLDVRTAYLAQQTAYQAWQAAIGNSIAAERLCILKEMDSFGCSALDRHALTDVTCPPDHQGTLDLISTFNDYLTSAENERSIWRSIAGYTAAFAAAVVAAVATGVTAGAAAPAFILVGAFATEMINSKNDTIDQRKRNHELVLQARSAAAEITTCWNQAGQYQRAIAAAESADKEATSRMQSATLAFDNNLGEARAVAIEAPVVINRERTRSAIPIAFHYWLPEALADYQLSMTAAQRYTYVALRATEYDALESFSTAQSGKPDRSTVIGATRPNVLRQQLLLMRDQTNGRQTHNGPPALKHIAFDLGAKFFGLGEGSSDFAKQLIAAMRPTYSQQGEYLGQGLRFSLVPESGVEDPIWRCAERIWRVNVGSSGLPTSGDGVTIKLQKRNMFASRLCGVDGLQVSTLHPGGNLLVAAGEPQPYTPEKTSTPADVTLQNFDEPNVLNNFKFHDDFLNGSSSELSMQGLYGDYVLLFPPSTFNMEFTADSLRDFWIRFDYLSVDNTPALAGPMPARAVLVHDESPITVQ